MGAKFSPSLANLFMGWWEWPHIYGDSNPFRPHIHVFFCYIDDLLFVCDKQIGDLQSFLTYLILNTSDLSFTGLMRAGEISFLEVLLVSSGDRVITRLYRKPLTGNSLLMAQSNHPTHTIKGSPVGQFIHLHRICREDTDFEKEAGALYNRFRQRGYPVWMLERALSIAKNKNRKDLLAKRKQPQNRYNGKPTVVTPFSQEFYQIREVVNKYLPLLFEDEFLMNILCGGINFIPSKARPLGTSISPTFFSFHAQTISHMVTL